jgi:hypothetical protein
VWLSRSLGSVSPRAKAAFGWEPRETDPRKAEAAFPEDVSAYPLPEALPAGFDNRFYNGYRRDAAHPPLPYLPAAAQIRIERDAATAYAFTLLRDTAAAIYYRADGDRPDRAPDWRAESVPMLLDTLVIEPDVHRCYVVWRGAWPFDSHPVAAYRRLEVTAST